jgi:uncharacterized integral membrane protein (TIGR00697 family)
MLPSSVIEFFAANQDLLWLLTITIDLAITLSLYWWFGKIGLYGVIVLNIMLSNLQGPKLTVIFGMPTSLGVILYSGIYFATDLLSERYGKLEANRAVLLGFASSLIVVFIVTVSILFLPAPQAVVVHNAITLLFGFTPRFVFGSLFAYLISQSFDVWIFHYLKEKTQGRHLWFRNNVSTLLSQAVDTVLYSLVVWWGIVALNQAIQLGIVKYIFKVIIALIDTPFIYWARSWNVEKRDWYDSREHHSKQF